MKYPEFESDFLFASDNPTFQVFIEKILIEKIQETGIIVESKKMDKNEIVNESEWLSSSSIMNIFVNQSFLNNHLGKNDKLALFFEQFKEILKPLTKITQSLYEQLDFPKHRPFVILTIFYKTHDDLIFKFLFDIKGDENEYINIILQIFDLINEYNQEGENQLKFAVRNSFTQNNQIKYFLYSENKWYVLNPLIEVSKNINKKYRDNKDYRVSKPSILMQRDNYQKYLVLDENWVLEFDGLETLLIKPNDVSLYSNISSKHLEEARKFYDKVILPRHAEYGGAFPSVEKQKEYYDYFELVISSVIFAYTSIEAFANICIPEEYKFLIEKDGIKTIYSKQAIERKFSLREKLKNILSEIIKTPDITKEKWWNIFLKLEDIRNEIIHTKESKSETRYSKFLSKDIFELIEIHKEIIHYYGVYISKNSQQTLKKYPYDFGFDEFIPSLTTNDSFERSLKVIKGNY